MSEPWFREREAAWIPSPQIQGKMDGSTNQEEWNRLWRIHAPPKAKHLIWRICKECLPTRTRLQESIQAHHSAGLEKIITPRLQHHSSAKDVILDICSHEDKNTAGAVAVLLWVLWSNRNNSVWNDEKESGRNLGFKARQLWDEWHVVHQCQQASHSTEQQQQLLSWQKPSLGWYKCNVDAGFHQEINKTSIGWCLRNHRDLFAMAGTVWAEGICSIVEGESMALLEAMKEMERRGITHVIFETDSKSVVDAIHNLRGGNSEISSIICHINNVLLSNPNFVVKFIKRQANMVVYTLARVAISWSRRCILETLPLCITALLK